MSETKTKTTVMLDETHCENCPFNEAMSESHIRCTNPLLSTYVIRGDKRSRECKKFTGFTIEAIKK